MKFQVQVDGASEVPLRNAATVMLVRDGTDGVEVFMLRRNLNSDFVGGAYVFPGGGVDLGDEAAALEEVCYGRTDTECSALLDLDRGGLAFWVAAIRESFEEAGLLMALDESGELVRLDDESVRSRFVEHRRVIDSSERSLVDVVTEERLMLATDRMHYFSRWITPVGAPRRYDTRFFIAHPPEWQEPAHDDREVIANLWIRPIDALERHAAGDFELIFPTVRSLEALAQFDTAEQAVKHAAAIETVDPILPRLVEVDGGLRIVLPNDEQYDAATSTRIQEPATEPHVGGS